ncbi:MAG TPA: hypothetical protein VIV11_23075 [Kofleriaceae bacterium]
MILFKRIFAGLLIACAFMVTLGNMVSDSEKARLQNQEDWPKVILFDLVVAGFGGFLLWSAQRSARSRKRAALIAGYVRSHPRVKLHDLAGYLGIPRAQAEEELLALVESEKLDLIIHLGEEYIDRKLLPELNGRVVDKCGGCGAATQMRVVLPGEDLRCSYCGGSVLAAAS